MAFLRKQAECPFCGSTQFTVGLFVNDMPLTDDPTNLHQRLALTCSRCGNRVFEVTMNQDKQVSAAGVSVCDKCAKDLYEASGKRRRREDIPATTFPVGTERCPRCNGQLGKYWWHGWDYEI